MLRINNEQDYQLAIDQIEIYIKKGFSNLSTEETNKLQTVSTMIAGYERELYPVPKPSSISEMLQLKMYELGLIHA